MKGFNRIVACWGLVSMLTATVISCGPGVAPQAVSPTPATAVLTSKTTWQQEWDNTVALARKEGQVSVIASFSTIKDIVARPFKEKYGVELDFLGATLSELGAKIAAERRSGLYLRDVAMGGVGGGLEVAASPDMMQPLEQAFILPEVKDVNAWRDRRLPLWDKEGKYAMYLSRVAPTMLYNTEMVKPGELKSWRSLLEPKWKGKILLYDPSIAGPGQGLMAAVSVIMGIDFLKELSRQDPVINRDKRLQSEWVAKGKYPIGLGFDVPIMEEMRSAGAPLAHTVPSEGSWYGSGSGSIAMFDKSPHPNAARVFVNWFLSKEGQTLFVTAAKEQSRRLDVKPELPPDRLFQEGINYIDGDSDDVVSKKLEILKLSKEIFAAQYK